jgi:hypothetical protein
LVVPFTEGAVWSCDSIPMWAMVVARYLCYFESSNLKILMRGLGYHKEVEVVQMWSDMYSDHGEYILT